MKNAQNKPEEQKTFSELGKQAYMDSMNSRQAIIDKYKIKTDPILQQNDYYVSKNLISFNQIFFYRKRPNLK